MSKSNGTKTKKTRPAGPKAAKPGRGATKPMPVSPARAGTKQAVKELVGFVPTMVCRYPDIGDESPTDPAELYRREIEEMLKTAELV